MEQIQKQYFQRDISWLSFNYRVLMEAKDESVPLYDRIKFLSIYSSNLEEFYRIRISEYRKIITKNDPAKKAEVQKAAETLEEIHKEVSRQLSEFNVLFETEILSQLATHNIILYPDEKVLPVHSDFVKTYFKEEIFPFLQPVLMWKDRINIFLRDNRLYLIVKLYLDDQSEPMYASIKIPYAKVPRFVELPSYDDKYYLMFVDDMIIANLKEVFPGFTVDSAYTIRISRDADFALQSQQKSGLVDEIRQNVKKRKIGETNRLVYDSRMPESILSFLCKIYHIQREQCISAGKYRTLEDLKKLPNPTTEKLTEDKLAPLRVADFDQSGSMMKVIKQQDVLLFYPYQSFDYFIRFLTEAAYDPKVEEIKLTQYRVAENSAVINTLIVAAKNGKKITVFVELKARFDEENNIRTSELMERSGIRIVYSNSGLKVHAKVALVLRCSSKGEMVDKSFAYLSTGNFNEDTAKVYSDFGLFTYNRSIVSEVNDLFSLLEDNTCRFSFDTLLVSPCNMVDELKRKIEREAEQARLGNKAHIILKMNGLQDTDMIDQLYKASEAGVQIDLIVRGICCLIPGLPYSKNIRVIRLVDSYLEHARVWYFYAEGEEELYLASADWMKRNLSRRIETAFPVFDPCLKQRIISVLQIQLADNVKACSIDKNLNNNYVSGCLANKPIRAQHYIYHWLSSGGNEPFDKCEYV